MAKIRKLKQPEWNAWVASRPESVRKLCRSLPPDRLYRLKTSSHRVTIYSYSEDGTVTVIVSGDYNALAFERRVFGIKPEQLEECDLPPPDEPHGVVFTEPDQFEALIAAIRGPEASNSTFFMNKPQQPEGKMPMNLEAEPRHVQHAALPRADDSLWRSECPVCADGLLLVRRSGWNGVLQAEDNCIACGQRVVYDDIAAMRERDGIK